MKHVDDDLTMDMREGIPVKLTRFGAERKKAMGYIEPKERPSCRSCKLRETVVHFEDTCTQFERHWCMAGGFRVQLGGYCRAYLIDLTPTRGKR
jgi:hypothetical protein